LNAQRASCWREKGEEGRKEEEEDISVTS
jgi:hypothetical protein